MNSELECDEKLKDFLSSRDSLWEILMNSWNFEGIFIKLQRQERKGTFEVSKFPNFLCQNRSQTILVFHQTFSIPTIHVKKGLKSTHSQWFIAFPMTWFFIVPSLNLTSLPNMKSLKNVIKILLVFPLKDYKHSASK